MKTKIQTDAFHQYAIDNYGIGGKVTREKLLNDIQRVIEVDFDRAKTLLLLMVGVKYFKEEKEKLYIADKTGDYFDNSLIKYWMNK